MCELLEIGLSAGVKDLFPLSPQPCAVNLTFCNKVKWVTFNGNSQKNKLNLRKDSVFAKNAT